ncbi:MAG: uracil-DNA glycosylase [Burkholderiaceae bacterium]|jgi:uracil-DNA glycosylase|nr:uracil-DNA glycosylase [Burkholderiaceae bacterium]
METQRLIRRHLPNPLPFAGEGEKPDPGWQPLIDRFWAGPQGGQLHARLAERRAAGARIYPPQPLRVFALTPRAAVRVVIVGQDPYHGPGQANGLAFAVGPGVRPPPSLRNIGKELARSLGRAPHSMDGLLDHWARQGVLLLNRSLTVEEGQPGSHADWGWEQLTGAVLQELKADASPLVFMLWGAQAQSLLPKMPQERGPHLWLAANHPSPLSALRPPVPFIGCDHFRLANGFLSAHGLPVIDWLGPDKAA